MVGRVNVNTSIKEVAGGKQFRHLLRFTVSEPSGFTASITSRKPEACFKYRRVSLTEPLSNEFLGVCTLDEFMTLSSSSGGRGVIGEVFRSSTFFSEYTDYNTALSDQKRLELQVWDFYNNLNAYTVSEAGAEADRSYVFPDYTEELLNSLITRHRMLRFQNTEALERVRVIEGVILPLLNANYDLYKSLEDASDLVYTRAEYYKVNLINIISLKSGISLIRNNLKQMAQVSTFQDSKLARILDVVTELEASIESVVTDEDDLLVLKNILARIKVESRVSDPVETPDSPAVNAAVSSVLPGIRYIENVESSDFTDMSTVETLVKLVSQFGQGLDTEIKTQETLVKSINDDIESRKGEIQDIEARMRSIRPSIDVTNPETAWYLTVNIDNG